MIAIFGNRKRCPVCHEWMRRFENPERWICLKEGSHAAILKARADAEAKKAAGRAKGRATQARQGPSEKQREQGRKLGQQYGGKNKIEKPPPRRRKTMDPGTGFVKPQRISAWNKKNRQPTDPETGKFVKGPKKPKGGKNGKQGA